MSRADWERTHGALEQEVAGFFHYEDESYAVMYLDGNVRHVERTWGDAGAVTPTKARSAAKSLIPRDAKLVRSYRSQTGRPVELYTSASLKERFRAAETPEGEPESPWIGGKPGDFIVIYRVYRFRSGDRVTSIVASIGNNP
ncbi:hypothetical protein ElP_68230 [Tautonia plasticadhaerens]|uniref:Uncharacterized protein n=1 Tax=Tautonia plasticadhaerens TaxID=2527974 RepID=A0A518HDD1_9BACT|nr:hypothetical protein ElP_68230 [Tautonia plasticadhaerens]